MDGLYHNESVESRRAKRTKIGAINVNRTSWRSRFKKQVYCKKLFEALRHVRRNCASSSSFQRQRAVREAAYGVLAISAKGRTRWSRSILANRHASFGKKRNKAGVMAPNRNRLRKEMRNRIWKLPPVNRRLRLLGRLIPGCRKVSCSDLIAETADYVEALKFQVDAMAELSELLTAV